MQIELTQSCPVLDAEGHLAQNRPAILPIHLSVDLLQNV
jgi:hypothetical protein